MVFISIHEVSALLPIRSTLLPECWTSFRLCPQCVRGQSNTVDFDKVDRVEFNYVASVYRALQLVCQPKFLIKANAAAEQHMT